MKVSKQSHGRKKQGLKLVSRQFRKQRLALWAAGRGPDPSFTAMVFWPCEGVLGPELCRMKVNRQCHGRKKQGLKLASRHFRKQRLALWAAGCGPIRPSLPWCFGPARGSFARSCAR